MVVLGVMGVHLYGGFFLTGLRTPLAAERRDAGGGRVRFSPSSYLGARLMGLEGVFWGRLATDLAVGSIGLVWVASVFRAYKRT